MPSRPSRICRQPGCHRKTRTGYCQEHNDQSVGFNRTQSHPWYNHPVWKGNPNKPLGRRGGIRELHLLDEPVCRMCKDEGRIVPVLEKGQAVVDHIVPFRTGKDEDEQWYLFTDPYNLQTLCREHDKIKTAADRARHTPPRSKNFSRSP